MRASTTLLLAFLLAIGCTPSLNNPGDDDDATGDDDDVTGDDDDATGDDDDSRPEDDDDVGPDDDDDDSDPDDDDDIDPDDDDVGDDDDDDDDAVGPCEDEVCELDIVSAQSGCDILPTPDPMPADSMLVTSPAAGQVSVMHFDWSQGCCPQIDVFALAFAEKQLIEVEFTLYDDMCDCVCTLDVSYTLGEVPAGTWEVVILPSGISSTVTVL